MFVLGLTCTRCDAQYPLEPMFFGCPACADGPDRGTDEPGHDADGPDRGMTSPVAAWTRPNAVLTRPVMVRTTPSRRGRLTVTITTRRSPSIETWRTEPAGHDLAVRRPLNSGRLIRFSLARETRPLCGAEICEATVVESVIKNERQSTWASRTLPRFLGPMEVPGHTRYGQHHGHHARFGPRPMRRREMDSCIILCIRIIMLRGTDRPVVVTPFVLEKTVQY